MQNDKKNPRESLWQRAKQHYQMWSTDRKEQRKERELDGIYQSAIYDLNKLIVDSISITQASGKKKLGKGEINKHKVVVTAEEFYQRANERIRYLETCIERLEARRPQKADVIRQKLAENTQKLDQAASEANLTLVNREPTLSLHR